MKVLQPIFMTSAPKLADCPPGDRPEIALIGRSNVGKSSLLNFITARTHLAKVSSTPGRTEFINFFDIDQTWRLVDLPGYGFASGPKSRQLVFEEIIISYLTERPNLRLILVLVDSRLTPQAIDVNFVRWLYERGLPLALVFTKSDKLKPSAAAKNIAAFHDKLAPWPAPTSLLASVTAKIGRHEILGTIARALEEKKTGADHV
jgi:GTP-binding protein